MKANHEGAWVSVSTGKGSKEIYLEPGQFIFGRNTAAKELHMKPSSVRNYISKLKHLENLDTQPDTHYTIVTIINWPTYQGEINEVDRQEDNQRTTKGQPKDTNKNDKNDKNIPHEKISEKILSMKSRYSNHGLIDRVFSDLASTRKTNRIADTVLLAQLEKWARYPVDQVETGIEIYLSKNYAAEGKAEAYLYAIIKNGRPKPKTKVPVWY